MRVRDEVKRIRKNKERCGNCRRLIENCQCSYDFLDNIPIFIRRRAVVHYNKKANELYRITRITLLVNWILENVIPMFYITRSGCDVEEFPMQEHDEHDSARYIGALLIAEYNELIVNMYAGSYNSAIRCTRSVFEWLIKCVAAVSDASIISGVKSDRNKAYCFEGLNKAIDISKNKERFSRADKQEYKKDMKMMQDIIENKLKDFPRTKLRLQRMASTRVRDGIGDIPRQLNEMITQNISVKVEDGSTLCSGAIALYEVYDRLSQNVHMSQEELFGLRPGGISRFFDEEGFDETYETIMLASDVILYLLIILIDLDVFYWDKSSKVEWRKEMKKLFEQSYLYDGSHFSITKYLLDGKIWRSNPPLEFVIHPYDSQHQGNAEPLRTEH